MLSNKVYDILKWVCMVCLPAIGVALISLSKIWGIPYAQQITDTIMVVCTLIGSLLGISSATYYKDLGNGIFDDGEDKDE